MRIQMTPTNAEFNGEFNHIRLRIQIETRMSDEKKQKTRLQEKICLTHTKFSNFIRENSLNSNSNDTDKCRIQ